MTTTEKISLDTFLRARAKNHTEEVRLQQVLSTYSLEKKQWERRVFNETFEQRHLAYALKKNADEIKKRDKKKTEKRAMKVELRNTEKDIIELRFKMDSRKSGMMIKTGGDLPPVMDTTRESHDTGVDNVDSPPTPILPAMADQHLPIGPPPNMRLTTVVRGVMMGNRQTQKPAKKKVNLNEIVERLFPKSMRRARSMADLERLKHIDPEERAIPPLNLAGISNDELVDQSEYSDDYWNGDPKAIGSVRRPRLPPNMMSARSKNIGDVMKMIRDLPVYPSCSKKCNKPGASFDDMLATCEKTMMPSLVQANVAKYHQGRQTPNSQAITTLQSSLLSFPRIKRSQGDLREGLNVQDGYIPRHQPVIRSMSVMPSARTGSQMSARHLTTR